VTMGFDVKLYLKTKWLLNIGYTQESLTFEDENKEPQIQKKKLWLIELLMFPVL
jgi:hypothetical protein